jgi:hypothetical protein
MARVLCQLTALITHRLGISEISEMSKGKMGIEASRLRITKDERHYRFGQFQISRSAMSY